MRSIAFCAIIFVLLACSVLAQTLQPSDFEYLGAFAIDDDYSTGGNDWNAYGQRGMTFDATGDPGNSDAFPGSLWVTGHDYEQDVFEISIPSPVTGVFSFDQLPKTPLLTNPATFTDGCRGASDWFAGVEVHGDKIWGSCAHWYNVSGEDLPDVMWRRNLSDLSSLQGPFHAGPVGVYGFHSNWQGMYMLSIPPDWAAAHLGGKTLATGLHRGAHGGQMGPTILAFDPDNPSDGYPLLHYRQRDAPGDNCYVDKDNCDYPGYTACDIWLGATWVRTPTADAVLISGKKYDGESDYQGGGWVCDPGFGEIIFYDPDDLAARVSGALEPWEVIPYETWRPSEFWSSSAGLGGIAFDQDNGYLYVIEFAGTAGRTIVHVWQSDAEPPPPPVCGDGNCDPGEDYLSCPADCPPPPPVCGDDICEVGEDCPADCEAPPPVCGDGVCEAGEEDCLEDCCPTCPACDSCCPTPEPCDSCCPTPPSCDSCCPTCPPLGSLLPTCDPVTQWTEGAAGELELKLTWDCP